MPISGSDVLLYEKKNKIDFIFITLNVMVKKEKKLRDSVNLLKFF